MKGGNVDWLPNSSTQDKITNSLAMLGQTIGGNSATTWPEETFLQITNNGGLARTDFDASTHDKKFANDKIIPIDWGSFVAPQSLPGGNSFGERFSAFAEGFKNLLDVGSSLNQKNDYFLNVPVPNKDSADNGRVLMKDSLIKMNGDHYRGSYNRLQDTAKNRYKRASERWKAK